MYAISQGEFGGRRRSRTPSAFSAEPGFQGQSRDHPHCINAHYFLVQPVGIEPTSEALQAPAMTTSAKVALGSRTGIEPVLTESQSVVLTVTLTTPYN